MHIWTLVMKSKETDIPHAVGDSENEKNKMSSKNWRKRTKTKKEKKEKEKRKHTQNLYSYIEYKCVWCMC